MNVFQSENEALLPTTTVDEVQSSSAKVGGYREKTLVAAFVSALALLSISVLSSVSELTMQQPATTDLLGNKEYGGDRSMDWDNQALGVMCPNTQFFFNNGNNLYSESKEFYLAFQSDGNMVIYHRKDGSEVAIWSSNTQSTPKAWDFEFQEDGHLLAHEADGVVKWKSKVYDWFDSVLVMQNDGNLVEYDRASQKAVWWSGSFTVVNTANVPVDKLTAQCFTKAPSAAPVADPTALPTLEPTFQPTVFGTGAPTKFSSLFVTSDADTHKTPSFSIAEAAKNTIKGLTYGKGPSCSDYRAPLKGFGLGSNGELSVWWNYKCTKPSDEPFAYQGVVSKKSVAQEVGGDDNGGIIYLDRQSAYCDTGSYMTSFNFVKSGDKMLAEFDCVKYASTYTHAQCVETASNYNHNGDSLIYLDRHTIECGNDMGLQGFRGQSKNGFLRVLGTCCPGVLMYPSQSPTDAPVPSGTKIPIPDPTLAPTEKPSANPTKAPYATPTLFPTLHPTLEPNAEPTMPPTLYPSREPITHPTVSPISEPTLAPNVKLQIKASKVMKEEAEQALEKAGVAKDHAENEKLDAIKNVNDASNEMKKLSDQAVDEGHSEVGAIKEQKDLSAVLEAKDGDIKEADGEKEVVKKLRLDEQVKPAAEKVKLEEREKLEIEKVYKEALEEEEKADIDGDIFRDEVDYARINLNSAVEAKDAAIVKWEHAEALYDNAEADLAAIKAVLDDSPETLACPFTFYQGVDKVVVPNGCVFIGTNDVTFNKQREMITPAAYYCTKNSVPLQLVYHDLIEIGLNNSISTIEPGKETDVRFYEEDNFMGQTSGFSFANFKPLNSFLYDDRTTANDKVKSLVFLSYASQIPATCDDLKFDEKAMELNVNLMKKGGRFFAESNPKNPAIKGFMGPLELNRVEEDASKRFVPVGLFEKKESDFWKKAQSSSSHAERSSSNSKKATHSAEWFKAHSDEVVDAHRKMHKLAQAAVDAKKEVISAHAHLDLHKTIVKQKESNVGARPSHSAEWFKAHSNSPVSNNKKPAAKPQHSAEWFKAHPSSPANAANAAVVSKEPVAAVQKPAGKPQHSAEWFKAHPSSPASK